MSRTTVLLLVPCAFLLAASDCDGGSTAAPTLLQAPNEHPVYDSGDLGTLNVLGASTEARGRFTLGPDEIPLAVIVEGEYVPNAGNSGPASAELWIYDTKGDQDQTNDFLVGALPMSSPFSRAHLSLDRPGTFSIRTALGTGAADTVALAGGTWSAHLRVNTTAWYGTITVWKLSVVTLKGVRIRHEPGSFIRDQ